MYIYTHREMHTHKRNYKSNDFNNVSKIRLNKTIVNNWKVFNLMVIDTIIILL